MNRAFRFLSSFLAKYSAVLFDGHSTAAHPGPALSATRAAWRKLLSLPISSSGEEYREIRGKGPEKTVSVQLSPRGLLAAYGAETLEPYLHRENPVLSDESGLVFLRTVFHPEDS